MTWKLEPDFTDMKYRSGDYLVARNDGGWAVWFRGQRIGTAATLAVAKSLAALHAGK